jgi:phosphohistidine phosphatase SixA
MQTGELEVVGHEPLTEEDIALLEKTKKKPMVHMSEIVDLKGGD